jgi:hypothetical protein
MGEETETTVDNGRDGYKRSNLKKNCIKISEGHYRCSLCGKHKEKSYFDAFGEICDRCAIKGNPKTRRCLQCDKEFLSLHDRRICEPCKRWKNREE